MIVDKKTVEYVADLAKLRIAEGEIDSLCSELNKILDYMDEINSTVDTESVDSDTVGLTNIMREDSVSESVDRSELLKNAPVHTEETPVVPKTVR